MKQIFLVSQVVLLLTLISLPIVSADRPGTAVQLFWPFDNNYNFDIDLKILDAPSNAGIFWAHQFGFVGGSGGYLGFQVVGSAKKAIFSIWGALCGSSGCQEFSTEGTGWSCLIDYDWKIDVNYRLRIWVAGTDSSGNYRWLATALDYSSNSETAIGTIIAPASFGWLSSLSTTWVEYFAYSTCDVPYTRAIFSYPFARNAAGDHGPRKAIAVLGGTTCRNSNAKYLGNGAYVVEAGQGVERTTPDEFWLWTEEPSLLQQPIPEFAAEVMSVLLLAIASTIPVLRHLRKKKGID